MSLTPIDQLRKQFAQTKRAIGLENLGIWDLDLRTNHLVWDEQLYRVYGIKEEDFDGSYEAWASCLHEDDRQATENTVIEAIQCVKPINTHFRIRFPNGEVRTIKAMATISCDEHGKATRITGVNWDISEEMWLKATHLYIANIQEKHLSGAADSELYHYIVEQLLMLTDCDYGFIGTINTNLQGKKTFQLLATHPKDHSSQLLSEPAILRLNHSLMLQAVTEGENQIKNSPPNKKQRAYLPKNHPNITRLMISPIIGPEGLLAVYGVANRRAPFEQSIGHELSPLNSAISGIISVRNHYATIEDYRFNCPLTKLYNRYYFNNKLEEMIKEHQHNASAFALFVIDLDNFKQINALHGHAVGDNLLRLFSLRLKRHNDKTAVVARTDGDEFALLIPHLADFETAECLAKQLHSHALEPYHIHGKKIYCPLSMGITYYPNDGDDKPLLIKHANLALFEAKKSKQPVVFYRHEIEEHFLDNLRFEKMVQSALANNQYSFYYQPIVDSRTKAILGVEALARLTDEDTNATLNPENFISKIERLGLAEEFNFYTLWRSISDMNGLELSAPLKLSINVSPVINNFPAHLDALVKKASTLNTNPLIKIQFEITESSILGQQNTYLGPLIDVMATAKQHNITFAIDDFGVDYSSINRLTELDFDTLKIDISFTDKLDGEDPYKARAIVSAIISMANSLSFDIITEGVETHRQEQILSSLGCYVMQGFLYYQPQSLSDIAQLLAKAK